MGDLTTIERLPRHHAAMPTRLEPVMLDAHYPCYIANKAVTTKTRMSVIDKYSEIGRAHV